MGTPFGNSETPGSGGFGGSPGPGFGSPSSGAANGFGPPASNGSGFGSVPNGGGSGFGASSPGGGSGSGFGTPSGGGGSGFGVPTDNGGSSGFDATPGSSTGESSSEYGTGPWPWVIAATATAVIGLILGIVAWVALSPTDGAYTALAFGGWALAGIVTFVLLGVHLTEDTRRQAAGPYIGNSMQSALYRVAAGVGLVAVVVTAIEIALWASKLGGM